MNNIEKALYEYNNTFRPTSEIIEKYGLTLQLFMRYLQLLGGLENSPRIKKALEMYKAGGITLDKVAKTVGITRKTLSKYVNQAGIEITQPLRKYSYDDDFFEIIDTEEKAYWLGFIYADGSIIEAPNGMWKKLEIGLKESDRGHLIKFLKDIGGSEKQIQNRIATVKGKQYNSCRVGISCTKMCDDLIGHGASIRKSLTLTFPKHLDEELMRHFLRGYFDGDGCISYRSQYGKYRIALVGTESFLNSFLDYFCNMGITKVRLQRKQNQKAYQFEKQGKDMRLILKTMYKGATVYLERKYNLYLAAKK